MRVNEYGGRDGAGAGVVGVRPGIRLGMRKSMTALFGRMRSIRAVHAVAGLLAFAAVPACTPTFNSGGAPSVDETVVSTAETLGSGSVRVAMLLPQSATGNAGSTGRAYRNAAELATRDFPDANIQLAFYDSGGSPSSAQVAADKAVADGA